jgi:hypothetical protein
MIKLGSVQNSRSVCLFVAEVSLVYCRRHLFSRFCFSSPPPPPRTPSISYVLGFTHSKRTDFAFFLGDIEFEYLNYLLATLEYFVMSGMTGN